MALDLENAAERVLLGESLLHLAADYRQQLIGDMNLGEGDVSASTFRSETERFISKLCRHLGDRHGEDNRVMIALRDWCLRVEDYDAYDVLLSGFRFDGREVFIRRGRQLFPGPLTAHWDDI